ncbi:MAG: hypothetical protein PF508_19920 [Spirochaeta sp.]|jgi:type II secretory pathway component GspD/PulD (secretin)|nr:hypothetical protein [Spirochaeta sp.]
MPVAASTPRPARRGQRAGRVRRLATPVLCALFATVPVASGFTADPDTPRIETFSVRDEPVGQVLLAFAEQTGISVVMDATVTGSVSVVLHDVGPRQVLNEVARAADLFVHERNGVYWLSKVRVRRTSRGGWQLDSKAARLQSVVAAIVRESGRSVVVRDGADRPVTTTARGHTIAEILAAVAAGQNLSITDHSDTLVIHEAERDDAAFHSGEPAPPAGSVEVTVSGDGEITLHAREATTEEILTTVADRSGTILLATGALTQQSDALELSAGSWNELYRRIGVAVDVVIERDADLLLVEPRHRTDAFEPFRRYAVFPTGTVPASEAADLLGTLPNLSVEWVDARSYRVVVSGLPGQIERGRAMLATLTTVERGDRLFSYRPTAATAAVVAAALAARFPEITFHSDAATNTVFATLPSAMFDTVHTAATDQGNRNRRLVYRCRHVTPEVARERIRAIYPEFVGVDATDRHTLVLHGPPALHEACRTLLTEIDRPVAQVRYDLCIIQYQHGDSRQHGVRASVEQDKSTTTIYAAPFTAAAAYDRITSFQFDFLSALGYRAALGISEELNNNTARMVVDTSLRARDGTPARLENASTFRYRDVLGDDESDGYRAVTREIDSGLTIELTGTVRGNRTVSVDIAITLSRSGTDMSGNGNPPPTSRKRVETSITAIVGQPVVIGGLLHREDSLAEHRFPLLGRIPVVRRLVNGRSQNREETELVMYLSAFPEATSTTPVRYAAQLQELRRIKEEETRDLPE